MQILDFYLEKNSLLWFLGAETNTKSIEAKKIAYTQTRIIEYNARTIKNILVTLLREKTPAMDKLL